MDVRELSGLDLEGAKSLLLAFATDAKRLEKELAVAADELKMWNSRVALAESRGMAELAAAARTRTSEIASRIQNLQSDRTSMQRDVLELREALPGIGAKERSIDPDRLLAELQLVTGELLEPEAAKVDAQITKLEATAGAEDALAALKRRMGLPGAVPGAVSGASPDTAP